MNIRLAERELKTRFGIFTEILYYDGQAESIALVKGDVANRENVFCRVHSACVGGHVFNSIECECADEMAAAQSLMQKEGRGIIIYLDQEGRGNGHLALMKSIPFKKAGISQGEAYEKAGYRADARTYEPAAEILTDLKVRSVVLLTNNPQKADDLRNVSINVAETKQMKADGWPLKRGVKP
jgi:GTP cyclohydrolase II